MSGEFRYAIGVGGNLGDVAATLAQVQAPADALGLFFYDGSKHGFLLANHSSPEKSDQARHQAARIQVEFQAEGLGEGGSAVRQHQDSVAGALILGPGAHDDYVVDRDACDGVHALGP